jgi:hypothetical protein
VGRGRSRELSLADAIRDGVAHPLQAARQSRDCAATLTTFSPTARTGERFLNLPFAPEGLSESVALL